MSARGRLDRERIVAEAIALADTDGIAKVSMREVARGLGAEAMSLYHHVANKEALLDAMVDKIFTEMALPRPGKPWRTELQQRCASAREVLRAHPWAIVLMDSRANPGPATLAHNDAVIGTLITDGFTYPQVATIVASADAFVFGFALMETNLPMPTGSPAADPVEIAALAEQLLANPEMAAFPHLAAFATRHVMVPGYSLSDEFERGLALLLDSYERLRATG